MKHSMKQGKGQSSDQVIGSRFLHLPKVAPMILAAFLDWRE